MSSFSLSNEYTEFRSSISLKTLTVSHGGITKEWKIYDSGPKHVRCPIVFLPPASGTADVYFRQMMTLSKEGYRVISIGYPVYWTHESWNEGFRMLLDTLNVDRVHLVGSSLGGFLAQSFAQQTYKSQRVLSLFLTNTFADTACFNDFPYNGMYYWLPSFMLKRIILSNYPQHALESVISDSVDFMVERLESLSQNELASRLTLVCLPSNIDPHKLTNIPITILDVFDECAVSSRVREELSKYYPHSKVANLKSGGNFPFLSRPGDVTLHLKVHVRSFLETKFSPAIATVMQRPESFMAAGIAQMRPTSAGGSDDSACSSTSAKASATTAVAKVNATASAPGKLIRSDNEASASVSSNGKGSHVFGDTDDEPDMF